MLPFLLEIELSNKAAEAMKPIKEDLTIYKEKQTPIIVYDNLDFLFSKNRFQIMAKCMDKKVISKYPNELNSTLIGNSNEKNSADMECPYEDEQLYQILNEAGCNEEEINNVMKSEGKNIEKENLEDKEKKVEKKYDENDDDDLDAMLERLNANKNTPWKEEKKKDENKNEIK